MKQPRKRKRTYEVFIACYGTGPWSCYVCKRTVTEIGQGTWQGNMHHLDGNALHDVPENLVMTHVKCHQGLHPKTEERRRQISMTLKGRPSPTKGMTFPPEVNAKKSRPGASNPFFGQRHTSETLMKMRQPRRRETCPNCKRSFALNWITRHKEGGTCIPRSM